MLRYGIYVDKEDSLGFVSGFSPWWNHVGSHWCWYWIATKCIWLWVMVRICWHDPRDADGDNQKTIMWRDAKNYDVDINTTKRRSSST
jgi:hypothetical protein